METKQFSLDDLKRILIEGAGAEESVDLDGDILDEDFEHLGYESLALLETGAPALAVAANGTEDPAGYVTLAGLAREITALREAGRPAGGGEAAGGPGPDRMAR